MTQDSLKIITNPDAFDNYKVISELEEFAKSQGYKMKYKITPPKCIGGLGRYSINLYRPYSRKSCYCGEVYTKDNITWLTDGACRFMEEHKLSDQLCKQYSSIDRWDDNAIYFDPLMENIKNGNAKKVVDEMSGWSKSNIDPYTYADVKAGNANNSGEQIVFENGDWVLTSSNTTITLFKKYN